MTFKIKNARDFVDQEVTMEGWMYNRRGSGKIYFMQLRDGTGFMQGIVTEEESGRDSMDMAEKLTMESSLRVTGVIGQHPKKEDVFEMIVKKIEPLQIPTEEYPISKKEHGPDFLLDNRHLWLRSGKQWAIQRVRHIVIRAIHDFFHENDFVKIDTPILTPNA